MGQLRRHILVVEDDDWLLFVLRDILKRIEGSKILTARNYREAWAILEESSPDLLITDLRLPDVSGIDLTRQVVKDGLELVVIWITAYGCHDVIKEAERLDVYRCLNKPLKVHKIREIVREALSTLPPSQEGKYDEESTYEATG
jgi:DNA-binding NtrC family response regulator